KSTVTNVNAAKRTLPLADTRTNRGLEFKFVQGSTEYKFTIEGEPLFPGQSTEIKKSIPIKQVDVSKPMDLARVFDWSTSPIKRIDELRTGQQSHRTAIYALKAHPAFASKEADTPAPQTTTPPGSGGSLPGSPDSPSGGGANAPAANLTKENALEK